MIKFLLILSFIAYLTYKLGGFLFKILFVGATQSKRASNTRGGRKYSVPDSNVSIEHMPKKSEGFKGGDYIDYEEVK
ncbi:MAG: DUF4834 domain-containing protein [Flammeovirgaceae bacterium]|nr:DUF4834 domain-containing protein [Flammeovirgaceae bacterium]|tara:strand:- start:3023 stop:3253 length:231 start_codon:yes stop_codon:yes gene_type:complete